MSFYCCAVLWVNVEKWWWKYGLKEMSALFLQGWPGITKLLDVFTRVVPVFASGDLLCRSPIIDPLRKARADPLRGRRGYRLAPRFVYCGHSICFNSFSLFYVILCYQRIYLREWYKKKECLFCFIINLTKLDLYTQFANPGFWCLSRYQTASCRFRRIRVLQQSETNPVHTLTSL